MPSLMYIREALESFECTVGVLILQWVESEFNRYKYVSINETLVFPNQYLAHEYYLCA